jgi:DNA-directed RNA polymerase subunit RPC12/RpoP
MKKCNECGTELEMVFPIIGNEEIYYVCPNCNKRHDLNGNAD